MFDLWGKAADWSMLLWKEGGCCFSRNAAFDEVAPSSLLDAVPKLNSREKLQAFVTSQVSIHVASGLHDKYPRPIHRCDRDESGT